VPGAQCLLPHAAIFSVAVIVPSPTRPIMTVNTLLAGPIEVPRWLRMVYWKLLAPAGTVSSVKGL